MGTLNTTSEPIHSGTLNQMAAARRVKMGRHIIIGTYWAGSVRAALSLLARGLDAFGMNVIGFATKGGEITYHSFMDGTLFFYAIYIATTLYTARIDRHLTPRLRFFRLDGFSRFHASLYGRNQLIRKLGFIEPFDSAVTVSQSLGFVIVGKGNCQDFRIGQRQFNLQ
jgi:hypothetical protein